jgi:hypothetical protein
MIGTRISPTYITALVSEIPIVCAKTSAVYVASRSILASDNYIEIEYCVSCTTCFRFNYLEINVLLVQNHILSNSWSDGQLTVGMQLYFYPTSMNFSNFSTWEAQSRKDRNGTILADKRWVINFKLEISERENKYATGICHPSVPSLTSECRINVGLLRSWIPGSSANYDATKPRQNVAIRPLFGIDVFC